MKKKFFAPLMGAVVLGLSAYAGYRTYDAYHGVSESDLLLANAEALADPREGNSLWFSNLRNVECTLQKVNGGCILLQRCPYSSRGYIYILWIKVEM
jgi:hypothetical protein